MLWAYAQMDRLGISVRPKPLRYSSISDGDGSHYRHFAVLPTLAATPDFVWVGSMRLSPNGTQAAFPQKKGICIFSIDPSAEK